MMPSQLHTFWVKLQIKSNWFFADEFEVDFSIATCAVPWNSFFPLRVSILKSQLSDLKWIGTLLTILDGMYTQSWWFYYIICSSLNQTWVLPNIYSMWNCEDGVLSQWSGEFYSFYCMLYHYFYVNCIAVDGCFIMFITNSDKMFTDFSISFLCVVVSEFFLDHTKSSATKVQPTLIRWNHRNSHWTATSLLLELLCWYFLLLERYFDSYRRYFESSFQQLYFDHGKNKSIRADFLQEGK